MFKSYNLYLYAKSERYGVDHSKEHDLIFLREIITDLIFLRYISTRYGSNRSKVMIKDGDRY